MAFELTSAVTLRIIRKQYLIEQLKQFKQGTPEHEATSKALDEILDELDKLRDLGKELAHDWGVKHARL
jgi:cytochrome c553